MSKKITIDTAIWTTQQAYADEMGRPVATINSWVTRSKIVAKTIPELGGLILVKRGSETARNYTQPKKNKKR